MSDQWEQRGTSTQPTDLVQRAREMADNLALEGTISEVQALLRQLADALTERSEEVERLVSDKRMFSRYKTDLEEGAMILARERDEARAEVKRLTDELERERVRLAGCGVAALGYATGENDCKPGDYGHSASFDDVKRLYAEKERLREALEWYADQYYIFCKSNRSPCDTADTYTRDNGQRARDALRGGSE